MDNFQETVLPLANLDFVTWSLEPFSSMGQRYKTSANPNIPGREFLVKNREIVVHFYKIRSLNLLRRLYVEICKEGFHELSDDLYDELEKRFEELEVFSYTDYCLYKDSWIDM